MKFIGELPLIILVALCFYLWFAAWWPWFQ